MRGRQPAWGSTAQTSAQLYSSHKCSESGPYLPKHGWESLWLAIPCTLPLHSMFAISSHMQSASITHICESSFTDRSLNASWQLNRAQAESSVQEKSEHNIQQSQRRQREAGVESQRHDVRQQHGPTPDMKKSVSWQHVDAFQLQESFFLMLWKKLEPPLSGEGLWSLDLTFEQQQRLFEGWKFKYYSLKYWRCINMNFNWAEDSPFFLRLLCFYICHTSPQWFFNTLSLFS